MSMGEPSEAELAYINHISGAYDDVPDWTPPTLYDHVFYDYKPEGAKMETREQIEARLEAALRNVERYEGRLAAIDSRPAEPDVEGGDPVIYWRMRFNPGGPIYTYAAVRCDRNDGLSGQWYTTGPKSPKAYYWEELWSWITDHDLVGKIWVADHWVEL